MNGAEIPRLVAREVPPALHERVLLELASANPVGALWLLLADSGGVARTALRSLLRSLIDEGRRYAETPDGARWRELLEQAPAVHNGWLLWNHANLDFYLRNAVPLADSPAAVMLDAWSELGRVDVASWLADMSRLASELDAGRATTA